MAKVCWELYIQDLSFLQQLCRVYVLNIPISQRRKLELRNLTKVTKLMDTRGGSETRSAWFPKPQSLEQLPNQQSCTPLSFNLKASFYKPFHSWQRLKNSVSQFPYLLNGCCEDKNETVSVKTFIGRWNVTSMGPLTITVIILQYFWAHSTTKKIDRENRVCMYILRIN